MDCYKWTKIQAAVRIRIATASMWRIPDVKYKENVMNVARPLESRERPEQNLRTDRTIDSVILKEEK